jgi:hypothetical protein
MDRLKQLVFFIIFISASLVRADIQTVSSIEELQSAVTASLEKRNPVKTLTILPLEEVILVPESPMFRAEGKKFSVILSQITKKIKLSKQEYLREIILTEYKQKLSDPKIIDFFKAIEGYGAPFMVVTRNLSGSLNKIPYLEVWTWSYLFENGIDLAKNPLGDKQIIFNKDRKAIKGTYPTFYRGLLSCNSEGIANSSQSLISTLLVQNLRWLPDVVYVIDTDKEYIKSIEQQFQSLRKDVQVFGFVYSPKSAESYDNLSSEAFLKFWTEVVNKTNSALRSEVDASKENPYEQ